MDPGWSVKKQLLRESILLAERLRHWPVVRHRPFSWGVRWAGNRFVPWAARTAFEEGIQEVNGIRMEVPRPPDWGGGGEFHMALGTYEHIELDYVLRRLRPGDSFLDVGAHIGYFTLAVARRVGSRGRVIAVEPWPASVALLRRNISLNGFDRITVVDAAASDQDGQSVLTVSSLSPMWNTLRQGTLVGETSAVVVATRRLDSVMAEMGWPPVAGIKIDVEGAESEVLRGSAELRARNPDAFLLFEVAGGKKERIQASLENLVSLEESGYRFRRLTAGGPERPVGVADLLPLLHRTTWQESLFNVVAEKA